MTWVSVVTSLLVGFLIVYMPFFNILFLTSWEMELSVLAIPVYFGMGLFVYAYVRKWILLRQLGMLHFNFGYLKLNISFILN